MRRFALLLLLGVAAVADTPCPCDPARPETLKERQCSLCAEAEKQPATERFFFVKDINPRKPNRMLVLPRAHWAELHRLSDMSDADRSAYLSAAIGKARELWGEDWAIAYNGDRVRTQCHAHIHIGKILPGVEAGDFVEVAAVGEIPKPVVDGFWIHGTAAGKMHVHTGEQIAETVLLR